ncbi:MAG TPA: choice-of-anchor tandem repeat GloVer-containing protein [Candidatus Acidoferrum sp.]|jgi:uncharacterized repeat protein (TIGR03803 family)|nr:choice-of-anchor tandem repeat GloVer-containing protein [Candidatus Acidoferrum sp.]
MMAWCVIVFAAPAQTNYQRIFSFGPSAIQGSAPRGQLGEASDGFLYGTTYQGGSNNLGTVFKIAKNGSGFTVLWNFPNGMFPTAGVIEGPGGALYGTTSGGGTSNAGIAFKLQKNGTGFAVLHDFASFTGDGNTPLAGLVVGTNGALYGATAGGGLSNYGCIFTLSPDGSGFSIIHSFAGVDGTSPVAGLIQGNSGALYGTAKTGGSNDLGTVFAVALDGGNYSVLHHFAGKGLNDGSLPLGPLVEAGPGFLFGTTYNGGSAADLGTIFRINTNGTGYGVLHSFQGGAGDGSLAVAGLSPASGGGLLYGTTPHGGTSDGGVFFGLSADGASYSVLHTFNSNVGDGSFPFVAPLVGSDNAIYGSTYFGGIYVTNGVSGTLFRLFSGPPQVAITGIASSSAGLALQFSGGAAGQTSRIQAATDLSTEVWQVIGTNSAALDGTFNFFDNAASNYSVRFYRSVSP